MIPPHQIEQPSGIRSGSNFIFIWKTVDSGTFYYRVRRNGRIISQTVGTRFDVGYYPLTITLPSKQSISRKTPRWPRYRSPILIAAIPQRQRPRLRSALAESGYERMLNTRFLSKSILDLKAHAIPDHVDLFSRRIFISMKKIRFRALFCFLQRSSITWKNFIFSGVS